MRFTIRDGIWLTVVVVLALGWGLEHWLHNDRLAIVKRHHPMLYEAMTGEEIDTNNLKSAALNRP
jgi:hypothetical protein